MTLRDQFTNSNNPIQEMKNRIWLSFPVIFQPKANDTWYKITIKVTRGIGLISAHVHDYCITR